MSDAQDHATATIRKPALRLLGSGTLLLEAQAAAALLRDDWQIETEVFSATSYSELARDARDVERNIRLHPQDATTTTTSSSSSTLRTSHLAALLPGTAPVVAVSDWVRAWPAQIAPHLKAPLIVLGTDGFGRSDTRAALRSFFEIDRHHIVLAALDALREQGSVSAAVCAQAIARYGISSDDAAPWLR